MRNVGTFRKRQGQAGIALLIAIFVLLLISVIAIALIVSAGTETALAGNYRSSTSVYYAASAGLEEVRARLRSNNPNSFKNTAPANFVPTPFGTCNPSYILNPAAGETVAPWTIGSTYFDNEFVQEFGSSTICNVNAPPSSSPNTLSIWKNPPLSSLPFPGPLFKWVRINGVSELSLNMDTFPYDTSIDTTPLYYDGTNLTDRSGSGQVQVLEITALAVLPNGSQKLLQYLVAPAPVQLPPFLAALTISGSGPAGNSPVFHAPANNASYAIQGNDNQYCGGAPTGQQYVAIGLFGDYSGYSSNGDLSGIVGGIPTNASGTNTQLNYTGLGPAPPTPNPPDVEYLTAYPASMQTPGELDAIVQGITQNADALVPSGSASTQQSFLNSLGMSPTKILTVVADGNLDVSSWGGTGYGLLLVTGTFTYDPNTTWNGIVLVIGQGQVNNSQNGLYQQINGAMFVAKTRDASGNLLTGRIGGGNVSFLDVMQGNGIRYSSDCINKSRPTAGFKILSFHEISQ